MPSAAKKRSRRSHRRKNLLLVGVGLLLTAFAVLLYATNALRGPELDTVDSRFSIRGSQGTPDDLLVVAIDDKSFGREGLDLRFQNWPRTYHARVLRNLKRKGAKVIAYDVQFTEPSKRESDDLALFDAADLAKPVVFATTEVDERGGTRVLGGDENLESIGARAAQALIVDDEGGVLRRVPYELDKLKSFSVAAVEAERRRPLRRPEDDDRLWIDFAGPPGTIETVSFSDVYKDKVPERLIRGRTVVVGPAAPSLQDIHPTSAGGGQMAGAEIQANGIATARAGFPLRSASRAVDIALIVLLGLIAPLLSLRLNVFKALAATAVLGGVFLVVAQLLFNAGTIVAVIYPLVALVLTGVGSLAVIYFTEIRERQRLRTIFSRFVPEAVVEEVVDRSDDARLGGTRLNSTVLFCDLRSFTTFAETLQAEQVIDVLNKYLGEMSDAILGHKGTLVAFMGDGIMAVFGAPIEMDDHADRALAAAQEMAFERLPRFNAWLGEQGLRNDFKMGVGLNSGPVMSGNVGSERRMEYTAVGDTTNTAARLEGMTKGSGFQIYISEATRALLADPPADLVEQGDVEIRGRSQKLRLWAVPDRTTAPTVAAPTA